MINVAILGAGIGAEHLAAYRTLPERYRVNTLCDLDIPRAVVVTGSDPAIKIVSSIDDVLNDPGVDVIDICLPPQLHAKFTVQALEAGKDVICEKPIARSLSEIDTIKAALQSTGRRVFPVFQYRYGLALAQLQALIDQELCGKMLVASAETHWNRDTEYYAVPWRGTWSSEAGGAILSHAIHSHDLLCHILGPVESLSAFIDTRVNDIEVEDCAAISMRMRSGALATSSVTLGAASDTSRFRFCFEHLTAESGTLPYAPAQAPWTFTARAAADQHKIDDVLHSVTAPKSGFAGFFEAVADALEGSAGNEVLFEDGRRSIEFVTAVYHSARQGGCSVKFPISKDNALFDGWCE